MINVFNMAHLVIVLCTFIVGSVVTTSAVSSGATLNQATKHSSIIGNIKQTDSTSSIISQSITSINAGNVENTPIERAAVYASKSVTSLPDITQASLSVISPDSHTPDTGQREVNTGQTSDNQHRNIPTSVPKSISGSTVIHSSSDITHPTKVMINDGATSVSEQSINRSGKTTSVGRIPESKDEIKNSESHVSENIEHVNVTSEQNRHDLNRNEGVIKGSQTTVESRGGTSVHDGYTAIAQPLTTSHAKNNKKTTDPETLHNAAGGVPAIMSSSRTSVLLGNVSVGHETHLTSDKPVSEPIMFRDTEDSGSDNTALSAAALQALSEMIETTILFTEPRHKISKTRKTHSTARVSDLQMQFTKSNLITGSTSSPELENNPPGHILLSSNLTKSRGNITNRSQATTQPVVVATTSDREHSTTRSSLVQAPVLHPIINNDSTILVNKSAINNNSNSNPALVPPYTANINTDSFHTVNVSNGQAAISSTITGSPILIASTNNNSGSAKLEPEESLHRIGYKLFNETVPPELSKYPKNITVETGKPMNTPNILIPVYVVNHTNNTDKGVGVNESDALVVTDSKHLGAPPILLTNESEIVNGTMTTEQSLTDGLRNQSGGDRMTTIASTNLTTEKVDFVVPVLPDVSNITNSTGNTSTIPIFSEITNTTKSTTQNTTISVLVPVLPIDDNNTKTVNETEAIDVTVLPDSYNVTKSGENITDIVVKPLIPSVDNTTEASSNATTVAVIVTPVMDVNNRTTPDVVNGSTELNKTLIVPSIIDWWSSSSSSSSPSSTSSPPPSSSPPAGNSTTIPSLITPNATAEITSVPTSLSTAALTVIITGSIVAFWIILGPLICVICKMRDKYKHGPSGNKYTSANMERGVMDKIIMTELKRVIQDKNNEKDTDNNDDVDVKGVNEGDDLVNVTLEEDTMLTEKQNIYNENELKDKSEIMPLNR